MMRPLRPLVAALALLAATSALRAQTAAFDAVPILVLIEEAVLSDPALVIPADGEIRIALPAGVPETALSVEAFEFDPRAGFFAARLRLADGQAIAFRGQAAVTVPAQMPTRRLLPGEIITEADLAPSEAVFATLPSSALRLDTDLVGKEVRRALLPGRPVPAASIQEPRAIRRGEKVAISYSRNGLDLSAAGRALEDGALGDQVRVVNLSSNRTITAAVAGPGLVAVE